MPYDEDGNWIDPEESEDTEEEGAPVSSNPDMAEYLRRANLQNQMSSSGNAVTVAPEYKAPPIGPEESKFRRLEAQAPVKQNFPVSGLRKGLGMLAGAVSGNPSVREGITDYKFNHAQSDFQQKLGVQQSLAAEEESATQRANAAAHLGAQTEAEKARREAEAARGARYQWMISPEGQKFELDKAKVMHPGPVGKPPEVYKVVTKDGSTRTGTLTPTGDFKDTTGVVIPQEQIDLDKTEKLGTKVNRPTNAFELWAEQNQGAPASAWLDLQNKINPKTKSEFDAYEEDYKKANPNANEREIVKAFARDRQEPQRAPLISGFSGGKVVTLHSGDPEPPGFRNASGESQVNTPTAATRGRGEAAQTAIRAGQDVINFANQNRQGLGQLGNYWKELISGTPAADPIVAAFQGRVASWAAFQAAAHGFRASTVMREFEDRVGKGPKNVDSVIATINGINSELQQAVTTGQGGAPPVNTPTSSTPTKRYNPATGKIEAIQ